MAVVALSQTGNLDLEEVEQYRARPEVRACGYKQQTQAPEETAAVSAAAWVLLVIQANTPQETAFGVAAVAARHKRAGQRMREQTAAMALCGLSILRQFKEALQWQNIILPMEI